MKTIQMNVYKYKETVLKPGVVYDIEDDAFAEGLIKKGVAKAPEKEKVEPAAKAKTEKKEG